MSRSLGVWFSFVLAASGPAQELQGLELALERKKRVSSVTVVWDPPGQRTRAHLLRVDGVRAWALGAGGMELEAWARVVAMGTLRPDGELVWETSAPAGDPAFRVLDPGATLVPLAAGARSGEALAFQPLAGGGGRMMVPMVPIRFALELSPAPAPARPGYATYMGWMSRRHGRWVLETTEGRRVEVPPALTDELGLAQLAPHTQVGLSGLLAPDGRSFVRAWPASSTPARITISGTFDGYRLQVGERRITLEGSQTGLPGHIPSGKLAGRRITVHGWKLREGLVLVSAIEASYDGEPILVTASDHIQVKAVTARRPGQPGTFQAEMARVVFGTPGLGVTGGVVGAAAARRTDGGFTGAVR